MNTKPYLTASILICTCNRASDLAQTLAAIGQVCVPDGMDVELLVVDNASTDGTALLVQNTSLPNMPMRYVLEPRRGKGYAYNTGMAHAHGDIFLFTDDDVRPPQDWIAGMCAPILAGDADCVVGKIHIAPDLVRSWMTPKLLATLAHFNGVERGGRIVLVGANMAFTREVLQRVPAFDTELGPGPAAGGDDTLFSWQLEEAGCTFAVAENVVVVHHFDPARLTRQAILTSARKGAISDAYLAHHWEHQIIKYPRLRLLRATARLGYWRARRWREWHCDDGAKEWEYQCVKDVWFYYYIIAESRRARNYEKRGLIKHTASSLTRV